MSILINANVRDPMRLQTLQYLFDNIVLFTHFDHSLRYDFKNHTTVWTDFHQIYATKLIHIRALSRTFYIYCDSKILIPLF